MRGEHLLEKLGCVDVKWVEDANKTVKKKRPVVWSAIAAALVACLTLGCFTLSDAFVFWNISLGAQEEILITRVLMVEDHLASYAIKDHTEMQEKMLSLKKGELYRQTEDTAIYRYEGRDDLAYMIFEYRGVLQLGEFDHFIYVYGEELIDSPWGEMLEEEQIKRIAPVTSVAEVLRLIYGVESAENIRSVTFQKSDSDNTVRGRSVKVKPVTLRDRQELAAFYDILSSLNFHERHDWSDVPISEKMAARQAEVDALGIPTVQLQRTILVKLKSGYELEMRYNGYGGLLRLGESIRLTDEANDWFIEHAGIDFTYQGYAENPIVTGCETATVRPPEEQTESEEDLNTVGSPPISSSS